MIDRYKQNKISSEIGIPMPRRGESDRDYAYRMIEEVTDFFKNYAECTGKKGYVCHITGGVDSFVTSMLIKRAGLFLAGLSLPYGNKIDMADVELARNIIQPDVFKVRDITKTVDECIELLKDLPPTKVHIGNTKARIRMTVLYRVAEVYDLLVAGSVNATELTMGMITKHGDYAADIQPLAGITKGIIYEMAKIFGAPQSIMNKLPTSGLWDNMSNREEVSTLNHQVCLYLRGDASFQEDFESKIVGLNEKSQHKRHLPVTEKDSWWVRRKQIL